MGIVRWLRRLVYLGLGVLCLSYIGVVQVTHWMNREYSVKRVVDQSFDVVLVLSAGIEPDGVPSFAARRRVRTAVWLVNQGITDHLIITGGPYTPEISASSIMKDLAIESGISPDTIQIETQARTTWENFRFSYPLLDKPEFQKIGMLTDPSHIGRALMLNDYFEGPPMTPISAWGQLSTSRYTLFFEFLREMLAWWFNLGKVIVWEVTGWFGYTDDERGAFIF